MAAINIIEIESNSNDDLVILDEREEDVTKEDEDQLWERGAINKTTALGLSYGVFFYNSKLFGLRARDEHRDMQRDQIAIKTDPRTGEEYIEYEVRTYKKWQGGLKHRKIQPKFITYYGDKSNPRDVVSLYKRYMEETPEIGAFYRKPLKSIDGNVKFGSQNVGVKILAQYTKLMFDAAGIDTTNRKIACFSHLKILPQVRQDFKTQESPPIAAPNQGNTFTITSSNKIDFSSILSDVKKAGGVALT